MKSRAERLDKILVKFYNDLQNDFARASYRTVTFNKTYDEARKSIVELFKECVPEERNFMSDVCMWRDDADMIKQIRGEVAGHAKCRNETLENIEELRG